MKKQLSKYPVSNFARLGRDSLSEGSCATWPCGSPTNSRSCQSCHGGQRAEAGQTLLQLARTMGKKDPRSIRIELKISHEELSEMVGTTRPRISLFMQRFRNLGLIEKNQNHFLVIKENKLTDYLAQIA
jgi:hypothetical protein